MKESSFGGTRGARYCSHWPKCWLLVSWPSQSEELWCSFFLWGASTSEHSPSQRGQERSHRYFRERSNIVPVYWGRRLNNIYLIISICLVLLSLFKTLMPWLILLCVYKGPQYKCVGQRTISKNNFSPSTKWVLGVKLKSLQAQRQGLLLTGTVHQPLTLLLDWWIYKSMSQNIVLCSLSLKRICI